MLAAKFGYSCSNTVNEIDENGKFDIIEDVFERNNIPCCRLRTYIEKINDKEKCSIINAKYDIYYGDINETITPIPTSTTLTTTIFLEQLGCPCCIGITITEFTNENGDCIQVDKNGGIENKGWCGIIKDNTTPCTIITTTITNTRRTTNTTIITTIKKLSPTNEVYISQYYQCCGINHQGSTKYVLIISNVFNLNNYYSQCL
ncbi:hypothetical protein H8356DRAFT_1320660 [Neocallimastix lanati (nom. inval.)]|nr:hypothetical protein H8356DRAFT_1320660 [Neocallimastix sp. JGI-2020a]